MKEFGRTDSSQLSIEEFMSTDLDKAHNPPSFADKRTLKDEDLKQIEEYSAKIQHDIHQLHAKKTSLISFRLLTVFIFYH